MKSTRSLILSIYWLAVVAVASAVRPCPEDKFVNTTRNAPVFIAFPNSVYPRHDILTVIYKSHLRHHLDLLIQALLRLQDRPSHSPVSYYQIAAIHGQPYQAWDGVKTQDKKLSALAEPINALTPGKLTEFAGYCWHASVLFPTWHRAYSLLFEQELRKEANEVAHEYSKDVRREYIEAAEQLRLPYWDWASEATGRSGMPEFLLLSEVEINTPRGRERVRNPFESYTMPEDVFKGVLGHDRGVVPREGLRIGTSPALRGDRTARHPNLDLQNDYNSMQDDLVSEISHYIRPAVETLLSDPEIAKSWAKFATHKPTHSFVRPKSTLKDIEGIHDTVHDVIGGIVFSGERGFPGHMSDVNVAAYDPIFFLMHSNLDRITTLYQMKNPESWVEFTEEPHVRNYMAGHTGINASSETPLWPFRKAADSFLTSDDVRNITELGYTYPEFIPDGESIFNYSRALKTDSSLAREFLDCELQLDFNVSGGSKFGQIAHLFRQTHRAVFSRKHVFEGNVWCPHSSLPWCKSSNASNATLGE